MKIVLICNTDGALYVFRKPLIRKLLDSGHEVVTISSRTWYVEKLQELGARTHVVDFEGRSISPMMNYQLFLTLRRILAEERPDIVHTYTHKPAIYGTIAAKRSGVRKIFNTITGLGTTFSYNDLRTRFIRSLLLLQYRVALRHSTRVFFQNIDDLGYFTDRRIVRKDRAVLVNGSGIDLIEHPVPALAEIERLRGELGREISVDVRDKIIILLPARALREKGFYDFYECSRLINGRSRNYLFMHLGYVDETSSSGLDRASVTRYARECGVHFLGFKKNINDYTIASDVIALPSTYREGVPRSLIEALAYDKYVITTDTPGCRETVKEGWNGTFCRAGSVVDLAERIERIDRMFLESIRGRSRGLCEEKFDVEHLNALTLKEYFG